VKRGIHILISVLLVINVVFLSVEVHGDQIQHRNEDKAQFLKELGLLEGTNKGFELEKQLSRVEGSVMLVRLLGKEEDAKLKKLNHPFKDVPEWANDYIGYLYQNNLTNGISLATFGSNDKMTYNQYITFILRAIGYDDKLGDFLWNTSIDKALEIKLIDKQEKENIQLSSTFLRDDMVGISYNALKTKLKDEKFSLSAKLIEDKVFPLDLAEKVGVKKLNTIDFDYDGIKPDNISWYMKEEDIINLFGSKFLNRSRKNGNTQIQYNTNEGKVTFILDNEGLKQFIVEKTSSNTDDITIIEDFDRRLDVLAYLYSTNKEYGSQTKVQGSGTNWGSYSEDHIERAKQKLKGFGTSTYIIDNTNGYTIVDLYTQINDEILYHQAIYNKHSNDLSNLKVITRETVGIGNVPEKYGEFAGGAKGWFWLYPDLKEENIIEVNNMIDIKDAIVPNQVQEFDEDGNEIIMPKIDRRKLPESIRNFDRIYIGMPSNKSYLKDKLPWYLDIYKMHLSSYSNEYDDTKLYGFDPTKHKGLIIIFKNDKAVGYVIN